MIRLYSSLFLVCAATSFLFSETSQAVTFSDSDFNDADWTVQELLDSTANSSFTFSAGQVATGGNPGAYRSSTLFFAPAAGIGESEQIEAGHLMNGATYDPSVSGAVSSIDWSVNKQLIQQTGGTPGVFSHPLILQGGTFFVDLSNLTQAPSGSWGGDVRPGLTANDFSECCFASVSGNDLVDPNSHPDFSSSGSLIQFGYLEGTGAGDLLAMVSITSVVGVDNWSVTVHPIPEPTSIALLAVGSLAVLGQRRRSRLS